MERCDGAFGEGLWLIWEMFWLIRRDVVSHFGRCCGSLGRCCGSLGEMLCLIRRDVVSHFGRCCGSFGRCGTHLWRYGEMWWLVWEDVVAHSGKCGGLSNPRCDLWVFLLLPQMIYNKTKQKISWHCHFCGIQVVIVSAL